MDARGNPVVAGDYVACIWRPWSNGLAQMRFGRVSRLTKKKAYVQLEATSTEDAVESGKYPYQVVRL
jgi:hypothetical protein